MLNITTHHVAWLLHTRDILEVLEHRHYTRRPAIVVSLSAHFGSLTINIFASFLIKMRSQGRQNVQEPWSSALQIFKIFLHLLPLITEMG